MRLPPRERIGVYPDVLVLALRKEIFLGPPCLQQIAFDPGNGREPGIGAFQRPVGGVRFVLAQPSV